MIIKPTFKFIISFLALTFLMHEAHEIVHTTVGRIICGCWGQRDFNVWGTCEGCEEMHPIVWLSTLAGPVFTFIMIWIGAYLLKNNKSNRQRSFGFALIFANLPFGRILNPLLGGGDEVTVLDRYVNNWDLSRGIIVVIILLITIYPLYKAFKTIDNKRRIVLFILFLLVPVAIDLFVVLGLLNTLLVDKGLLNEYWILGSPVLVTVWTIFVTTTFILTRKYIYSLADESTELKNNLIIP